jgi:hypothetical protein
MDVIVERHGGVAGIVARGSRNDASLTSSQRQSLTKLLASPPAATPAAGSDRFSYRLTITKDGVSHRMTLSEDAMPEDLAGIAEVKL